MARLRPLPFPFQRRTEAPDCLAAVLALRPEALILDEPTAGLDPSGRRRLVELLAGLNRERD